MQSRRIRGRGREVQDVGKEIGGIMFDDNKVINKALPGWLKESDHWVGLTDMDLEQAVDEWCKKYRGVEPEWICARLKIGKLEINNRPIYLYARFEWSPNEQNSSAG
jgi:hypothetical protein